MASPEDLLFKSNIDTIIKTLGKPALIAALKKMMLIRQFELRAEAAYLQGKIGGFFHSYVGQEAVQVAALSALGPKQYYTTTYRCHALALLLGVTPDALMAELFGKVTGAVMGRGGSMHIFADQMLGGLAIVGGHIPIGIGAAFTCQYKGLDQISVIFLGEGAMAQGLFSESLNLSSLWNLPALFVVENNHWGMGTNVNKAIANAANFSQKIAEAYDIKALKVDGMNFFDTFAAFQKAYGEMKKTHRPFLIECDCERFKGHSISDPGHYRTKDEVKACYARDPLLFLRKTLIDLSIVSEVDCETFEQEAKAQVLQSLQFADSSPWPDPTTLGQDIFAP